MFHMNRDNAIKIGNRRANRSRPIRGIDLRQNSIQRLMDLRNAH